MKLRYYIKNKKKTYTLKESEKTKSAHYKFIKLKNAPKNN